MEMKASKKGQKNENKVRKVHKQRITGKMVVALLVGALFLILPIGQINEVSASRIDAEIQKVEISPEGSRFNPKILMAGHDHITVRVKIKNTGSKDYRFWIGLSFKDSNSRIYDVRPKSVYLEKRGFFGGGESDWVNIRWDIPYDCSSRYLKMAVAVWEDYDGKYMRGLIARYKNTTWVKVKGISIM